MNLGKKLTFWGALAMPFRLTPVATILGLINSLMDIAIAPIKLLVTAYFINTALTVVTEGQDARRIVLPLVAMAAFSVYGYITGPLSSLIKRHKAIKTRLLLRMPFVEKRVKLEYKHMENRETVDLLNRALNDPEAQLGDIYNFVMAIVQDTAITISTMVILIVNAPLVGIVLLALSVPMLWLAFKSGKANYQAMKDTVIDQRYAGNFDWLLNDRNTAAERNMFGFSGFLSKKFFHHYEKGRKHRLKTEMSWWSRQKISGILMVLLSAASLFIMVPAVASGALSVGLFIALQGALFTAVKICSGNLPFWFMRLTQKMEHLKDVNAFLALSEVEGAEALPTTPPVDFETLEFRNVSFTYPGTEKVILDNLSLLIEKGKHYSFVGVNGAGKTTLTKLMTRLYDDYTGEILLNGKELREWAMADIKSCFCVLFQDFARYDITVAENVAIGKINGATDAEIDDALEKSGFEKTATELKDGKDTLLGKTHEDGIDLSGGQWQRLAFARAIISPAAVKILDEPTAALDPVAESQVYAQFESISQDFTTIFISHRLASAKLADTIFVLDGGKVVEAGNHETLVAAKGIYADMFESQQSWYL